MAVAVVAYEVVPVAGHTGTEQNVDSNTIIIFWKKKRKKKKPNIHRMFLVQSIVKK